LQIFSWNARNIDWFAWGDWLYLLCALSQNAQSFFMFSSQITDDDTDVFYLYCKLAVIFLLLFPFLFCCYDHHIGFKIKSVSLVFLCSLIFTKNIKLSSNHSFSPCPSSLANWLYLFDSLAYFIGYMYFVYDLRNALLTGKVPVNQTQGLW